jgi:predicted phosphodiesterase
MKDLGFDSDVLQERAQFLIGEIFEWVEIYQRPFEEFHIAIGGDILDGAVELRAGHSFQQDLHGAKQIAFAAELLSSTVMWVAGSVDVPVKVHAVTGNHGRATKNYREDPGRLCETICYMFAEKLTPGIEWNIHPEIVAKWKVYDTTCFLTHGDLTPKDLNSLVLSHNCVPPSLILTGHRHELSCSQKNQVFTVSGGSLCGTTSFSRDRLGLSSTPSQVLVEIRKSGPRPAYYLPV